MVRILVERTFTPGKKYIEAAGLSTDAKPDTGLVTGSLFAEADTQTVYMFEEVSAEWKTFAEFGSGS